MTSINLTREEANARSQMIDVKHYDVHLDLTSSETHFISTTVVSFRVKQAGSTFIDLRGEELLELRLNGAPCPPTPMRPSTAFPFRVCRWLTTSSRS